MIGLYAALRARPARRVGVVDFARAAAAQPRAAGATTPALLAHYRQRFRHVLVDEFQDTNAIQYSLAAGCSRAPTGMPFVVGDDDQSIYRWRGARVENLQRFQQDFPGAQLVRLEQNYRSTGNILEAANAVIANNSGAPRQDAVDRAASAGEPIKALRGLQRARRGRVRHQPHPRLGRAAAATRARHRRSCTARTRSRACSKKTCSRRAFRTASTAACGSSSAQEIKDALAYLRLIANRDDDASFERVVNLPTRGIGARTLEVAARRTRGARASLWRAARRSSPTSSARKRAAAALRAFLALIERLDARHARPRAARAGRARDRGERPHRALPQGQGRPRRGARREPRGARERGARLRAGGRANCRRSPSSSRSRCSSPATARPTRGRTACR